MSGLAKLAVLIFLMTIQPVSASFAVYYGEVTPAVLHSLQSFNLLILSPTVSPDYVSQLSTNATVVGYLSLATIGGWEPWAKDVPKEIVIGRNENWGEKVVNFSSPVWRRIVLEEAIPYILSRGFDGVFLDNLDYVDYYPSEREGMIDLIRAIRKRYPNIVIIANRGFSIKREIAPYVDYVLFEDFVTYYNFSSHRYEVFGKRDLAWEFEQIRELHTLNVPVLALSYADLNNESQVRRYGKLICRYAIMNNVSEVYLTDISLQRVGVDPCQWKETTGHPTHTNRERKRTICGPMVFLALPLILPLLRSLLYR